jgi:hypothetical protein
MFFSSSKKYKQLLIREIQTLKILFYENNNLTLNESISSKLDTLKCKYSSQEINVCPEFKPSLNTLKAIQLINEKIYNNIFFNKKLNPPINRIIIVYRVFFQLINKNEVVSIKNDEIFWDKASDYIVTNNCKGIGNWFCECIKFFDFSEENVHRVRKILGNQVENMKKSYYDNICETTALFLFLIKDALEYCGIIENIEKSIPGIKYRNLLYLLKIEQRVDKYISYIQSLF